MTKRNGYQPKPRNTNQRERKKVILLMAEGENKTETFYFKGLSNSSYVMQFAPGNYTDPVNMVNALRRTFDDLGLDATAGDVAYCLVDSDLDPKKDKQIACADAKAGDGIKMIVSCPCFEIWYVCHYTKSTRQFYLLAIRSSSAFSRISLGQSGRFQWSPESSKCISAF